MPTEVSNIVTAVSKFYQNDDKDRQKVTCK